MKCYRLLDIKSRSFECQGDGALMAPEIGIHGLVISTLKHNKEHEDFLTSKGAHIEHLKENGLNFVKITGNYCVSKEDVDLFLSNIEDTKAARTLLEFKRPGR